MGRGRVLYPRQYIRQPKPTRALGIPLGDARFSLFRGGGLDRPGIPLDPAPGQSGRSGSRAGRGYPAGWLGESIDRWGGGVCRHVVVIHARGAHHQMDRPSAWSAGE